MSTAQAIDNYEALLALTRQMHRAAADGEWALLVRTEQQRAQHLVVLAATDAITPLDEAARQHKARLIQQILADDVDIRSLTQAYMAQLQCDIGHNLRAQRVQQVYGVEMADAPTL